jgi:PKD repeat protein
MRHPLRPLNGGSVSIVLIGLLAGLVAALPAAPARAQFGQLFVSAGGPYSGSPGVPVTMFAQASGGLGGAYQYFWSFGDGTQGSGQSVTKTYTSPGTYTVQVSVSSTTGQTGTATTTATISGAGGFGQVSAGGPYTGLPGQAIVFTGSAPLGAGAAQFIWNFGDGTTATGQTVSKAYSSAGTYTVTLSVTSPFGGTVGSATTTATVGQGQFGTQVSAGGPYTGLPGQAIVFTGSAPFGVSAQQFLWNFGDGTSGSGQSVSHVYNQAGTYSVTLSVSSAFGGLVGTATTTATIGQGQFGTQVSAGGPYTGLPGQAIVFTGSAPLSTSGVSAQQFLWNFGDGTSGTGQSVSHVYNTAGTYSVTLTVTGATGLIGTATTTASVGTGSTGSGLVSAGGPYTGVPGQTITLSGFAPGVPNATQYLWNFGDGTSGSGQTATHVYANPGSYTATLTVTNSAGQTYSGTATVTVSGSATTPITGATTVVQLVAGCNNIASTWPTNTPTTTVAAAVSPANALLAIWRWSAAANRYEGFSLTGAAVSDLRTVNLLESLFFCVSSAASLTRPAY